MFRGLSGYITFKENIFHFLFIKLEVALSLKLFYVEKEKPIIKANRYMFVNMLCAKTTKYYNIVVVSYI